jgi:hypothetical protein
MQSEEIQLNTAREIVIFKGQLFPICLELLDLFAPKFAQVVRESFGRNLDLPESITTDCLTQFIKACQREPFSPNPESIYGLFALAHQYDVSLLTKLLNEKIIQNPQKFLVPAFRFRIDSGLPTTELENQLKQHYLKCSADDLKQLPTSILHRILQFHPLSDPELFNRTFDLALELYDRSTSNLSLLFDGVSWERLSPSQQNSLNSRTGFISKFLDYSSLESYGSLLQSLTREIQLLRSV